jgi:hypothetical protein
VEDIVKIIISEYSYAILYENTNYEGKSAILFSGRFYKLPIQQIKSIDIRHLKYDELITV